MGLKAYSKFDRTKESLRQLSGPGGVLDRLSKQIASVEKMASESKRIHFFVTQKLTQALRSMLASNWQASGLHSRTGRLYQAAIASATVEAIPKGITVSYGPATDQIYKQGGALNHGAVRAGGLGSRAKKGIKKGIAKADKKAGIITATTQHLGGATVIPAHPFFLLSSGQIEELQELYVKYWQEEINRTLRANARKGK